MEIIIKREICFCPACGAKHVRKKEGYFDRDAYNYLSRYGEVKIYGSNLFSVGDKRFIYKQALFDRVELTEKDYEKIKSENMVLLISNDKNFFEVEPDEVEDGKKVDKIKISVYRPDFTTIRVSRELLEKLKSIKTKEERLDEVIERLMGGAVA